MIQLFGQSQLKGKRPPCRNREPWGVLTEEQQRWKEVEGGRGAPTAVSLPKESVCLYFTQDDREVHVDLWVIQMNDSL